MVSTVADNFVLVTADSLRADHMGLYGYERPTTPELSSRVGTTFETAYAPAPYTAASLPSALTGELPFADGHIADRSLPTLATFFREMEYTTYCGHSNVQIPRFGLEESFDTVDGLVDWQTSTDTDGTGRVGLGDRVRQYATNSFRKALRKDDIRKPVATAIRACGETVFGLLSTIPPDRRIFENVREWIADAPEPYFVWLHLMNTHSPYTFQERDFEAVSDEPYSEGRHARTLNFARTHCNGGDFVWPM